MPRDFRIVFTAVPRHAPARIPALAEAANVLLLAPEAGENSASAHSAGMCEAILLEPAMKVLAQRMYLDSQLVVLASLGGEDPSDAVRMAAQAFADTGGKTTRLGVLRGHDLLDRIEELMLEGAPLSNTQTGEKFSELQKPIVAASAVLGHEPLFAALRQDARIVFAGHTSREAMATAATLAELGWAPGDARIPSLRVAAQQLSSVQPMVQILPDGEIAVGGETPPDAVQKKLPAVVPIQPEPSGITPIEIHYRHHYVASTVLVPRDERGGELIGPWGDRLQQSLAEGEFDSFSVETAVYCGFQPAGGSMAVMQCASQSQTQALSLLTEAISSVAGDATVDPRFPPHVAPEYRLWPTEAPSELFEWSVDIREAKDWLA